MLIMQHAMFQKSILFFFELSIKYIVTSLNVHSDSDFEEDIIDGKYLDESLYISLRRLPL